MLMKHAILLTVNKQISIKCRHFNKTVWLTTAVWGKTTRSGTAASIIHIQHTFWHYYFAEYEYTNLVYSITKH